MFYMEKLAQSSQNSIHIVSFQVPGTNGAKLMETGMFPIKDKDTKVNAKVKHFDFSSHSGKTPLQSFLRGLKGKPDIFVMHGEEESCEGTICEADLVFFIGSHTGGQVTYEWRVPPVVPTGGSPGGTRVMQLDINPIATHRRGAQLIA